MVSLGRTEATAFQTKGEPETHCVLPSVLGNPWHRSVEVVPPRSCPRALGKLRALVRKDDQFVKRRAKFLLGLERV